jgi:hypothetical protein
MHIHILECKHFTPHKWYQHLIPSTKRKSWPTSIHVQHTYSVCTVHWVLIYKVHLILTQKVEAKSFKSPSDNSLKIFVPVRSIGFVAWGCRRRGGGCHVLPVLNLTAVVHTISTLNTTHFEQHSTLGWMGASILRLWRSSQEKPSNHGCCLITVCEPLVTPVS